ncbi:MAG TPA: hypothetical protein DCM08_13515 [Microscillaceae bacterium]|jgi:hypothetical protein|nr:hypothetical protein [Microscillaceae bacterium]
MKKLFAFSLVALLSLSVVFAQNAISDFPDGYYRIKNKATGKYIDVEGNSKNNGSNVHAWQYNRGADSQIWYVSNLGNGMYTIAAKHSGKLLEIDVNNAKAGQSGGNGKPAQTWENAGTPQQKWEILDSNPDRYEFYLRCVSNNKSLDVKSEDGSKDGAQIQVWDLQRGNDRQVWVFEPEM